MRNKFAISLVIGVVIGVSLTFTGIALAGSLDAGAPPASTSSYTLGDVYNRLSAGTPGTESAFTEPSSGPGSTMHTLDEIMDKAPAVDETNGATAADVISGKTFWGLTDGAWGPQIGTFSVTGQRATASSGTISKILDAANSDASPDNPDTEVAKIGLLLNPESTDTLPNIIGVPSGYRYTIDGTTYSANVQYPASISSLLGNPTYNPYTGKPLVASHGYPAQWVDLINGYLSFTDSAPIALRLRSVMSEYRQMRVVIAAGCP